jgi:serine phosphatase RsbU (regulator of sigma subunit)
LDQDQTQIMTTAGVVNAALDDRIHYLEATEGDQAGRRYVVGPAGAIFGRTTPSDIVIADTEISRSHCRFALDGGDLHVTDLNSTNGVFVDGQRVSGSAPVPVGAVVRIGRQHLKHEWRTRRDLLLAEERDRDLEKAMSYVQALLPPPLTEGPIRTDWLYHPCAQLGGDAFGYGVLPDGRFVFYLIDVSGHGAGAALHSVAVMNLLRQRALPGADLSRPGEVLAALNAMFQMEDHAEMYFTMWYGVYEPGSRRLDFACAGHHAGYLLGADRGEAQALATRNLMIGAVPDVAYKTDSVTVPAGAALYLFSDGVFEIVTKEGVQWSLQDFLPLVLSPPVAGLSEGRRLFAAVTDAARPGGFDDDFSLLVLTFD